MFHPLDDIRGCDVLFRQPSHPVEIPNHRRGEAQPPRRKKEDSELWLQSRRTEEGGQVGWKYDNLFAIKIFVAKFVYINNS